MSQNGKRVEDVIIIGSGPAGYTAALYTARADLHPLVIEGFAWGGLLQQTTDVENYPGYPEGVMGPQMMQEFRDQAERFGTRFITDDATKIELSDEPGGIHVVHIGDQQIRTRAVILAMGAEPKKLGVMTRHPISPARPKMRNSPRLPAGAIRSSITPPSPSTPDRCGRRGRRYQRPTEFRCAGA